MNTRTINIFFNATTMHRKTPKMFRDTFANHNPNYRKELFDLANTLGALAITNDNTNNIIMPGASINGPWRDLFIIFGANVNRQVNQLASKIKDAIKARGKVHLNLFGFSRGGIAVFLLCKKLKDIATEKLVIQASVLDPVPGNFIWSAKLDRFIGSNLTLANQASDLRKIAFQSLLLGKSLIF